MEAIEEYNYTFNGFWEEEKLRIAFIIYIYMYLLFKPGVHNSNLMSGPPKNFGQNNTFFPSKE